MLDYLRLNAEALILTVAIEAGVAWLFGFRKKREQIVVALINVVTNPLLFYLVAVNNYVHLVTPSTILILCLEIGLVFVEWGLLVWILRTGMRKMLVLSLVMNMVCPP